MNNKKSSNKKVTIPLTVATTLITATTIATAKMFHDTFYRKKGKYLMFDKETDQQTKDYVLSKEFEELKITAKDGTILKGHLLRNNDDKKLIICVHGYHSSNFKTYAEYIEFYYNQGFNILIPNNRAHGNSGGKVVGFGWLDRLDIKQWIDTMLLQFGQEVQIVLHGISMGSSTVLMLSGEKLPTNVKCIIADCGFTSAYDEIKYVAHNYNPFLEYIVVPIINKVSKPLLGYNLKEASTIKQIKKSVTPTLFIHGDQDNFVPTYMVYELYNACPANKDLLIIEGANHAKSHMVNKVKFEEKVSVFINNYIN